MFALLAGALCVGNRSIRQGRAFITNGQVTRRDLRPHDWMQIWPELADARLARADIFGAQPQQEAAHG